MKLRSFSKLDKFMVTMHQCQSDQCSPFLPPEQDLHSVVYASYEYQNKNDAYCILGAHF